MSRDDWIVGGLALLLIIDLLVLPWFSLGSATVNTGVGSITVGGGSLTATDAPDGWLAILAVIALIALLADLAIERLSPQTTVPIIGGSRSNTRLVLAGIAAGFVVLKFLFHIHFSLFGFGFWAAVVLTAALVFSALRVSRGQTIVPTS